MGLSIHYKGNFKASASLADMIEEVQDIAIANDWKYHIFKKEFPKSDNKKTFFDKAYGISFSPPECEPVCLTFASNKKLVGIMQFSLYEMGHRDFHSEYISVKTQFAGPHIHKLVVHILKYISTIYLVRFKLDDEGEYWETGDENLLDKKFSFMNRLLNAVQFAFESKPIKTGETMDEYFQRVLKDIEENKKKSS